MIAFLYFLFSTLFFFYFSQLQTKRGQNEKGVASCCADLRRVRSSLSVCVSVCVRSDSRERERARIILKPLGLIIRALVCPPPSRSGRARTIPNGSKSKHEEDQLTLSSLVLSSSSAVGNDRRWRKVFASKRRSFLVVVVVA